MKLLNDYDKPAMTFDEWLPRTKLTAMEFLQSCGVKADLVEVYNKYRKYYRDAVYEGDAPHTYPDAESALNFLKGHNKKIAIVSSHPEKYVIREGINYGVLKLIDCVNGTVHDKKQGLKIVCAQFNVPRERALYTGDTVYDVRAAKEAGVQSAGICTGYHTKARLIEEEPDFLLNSLSEFERLFADGNLE